MKRILAWSGITFLGLMILGTLPDSLIDLFTLDWNMEAGVGFSLIGGMVLMYGLVGWIIVQLYRMQKKK